MIAGRSEVSDASEASKAIAQPRLYMCASDRSNLLTECIRISDEESATVSRERGGGAKARRGVFLQCEWNRNLMRDYASPGHRQTVLTKKAWARVHVG